MAEREKEREREAGKGWVRHEGFFIEDGKGVMTLDFGHIYDGQTKISKSVFPGSIPSCMVHTWINAGKE